MNAFNGGVIVVSHDQHFVDSIAQEIWVVKGDGGVGVFEGTVQDYKKLCMKKLKD